MCSEISVTYHDNLARNLVDEYSRYANPECKSSASINLSSLALSPNSSSNLSTAVWLIMYNAGAWVCAPGMLYASLHKDSMLSVG